MKLGLKSDFLTFDYRFSFQMVHNVLAMRSAGFQGMNLSNRTDFSQSCVFGFKFTY